MIRHEIRTPIQRFTDSDTDSHIPILAYETPKHSSHYVCITYPPLLDFRWFLSRLWHHPSPEIMDSQHLEVNALYHCHISKNYFGFWPVTSQKKKTFDLVICYPVICNLEIVTWWSVTCDLTFFISSWYRSHIVSRPLISSVFFITDNSDFNLLLSASCKEEETRKLTKL